MVAPYPAAEGLRRRMARLEAQGRAFPSPAGVQRQRERQRERERERDRPPGPAHGRAPRLSNLYCLISVLLAAVAIVTSSSSSSSSVTSSTSASASASASASSSTTGATPTAVGVGTSTGTTSTATTTAPEASSTHKLDTALLVIHQDSWIARLQHRWAIALLDGRDNKHKDNSKSASPSAAHTNTNTYQQQQQQPQVKHDQNQHRQHQSRDSTSTPFWKRLLLPFKDEDDNNNNNNKDGQHHHHHHPITTTTASTTIHPPPAPPNPPEARPTHPLLPFLRSWLDPALIHPHPSTPTDIIDKILTSTPRLLAIANLLLSITYLMHSFVADLFLGSSPLHRATTEEARWAGRERLGGFLVFKLLLISAVVAPDTLDLLILLSWYTLLSFLRSLAHLCAATTAHTSQSGQPPRPGVLRLLLLVLVCDSFQAAACVALFHGAGWGMVLLLTCDCALLGMDVICHILKHAAQALEETHARQLGQLEDRQIYLHQQRNNAGSSISSDEDEDGIHPTPAPPPQQRETQWQQEEARHDESRQLDHRMELMESAHARRLAILDTSVFGLQLVASVVTVAHFLHIWSLHGLQFTLIDGVLALHLHSALASAGKKISERRNLNRIARDLDGLFDDATELDLRKASASGDVCCICLGTMTTGNVKKIGCGHLYHTHCLREVVERARSIEAAKCPLCRASVLDGRPPTSPNGGTNGNGNAANNNNNNNNNIDPQEADAVARDATQGVERALFRFSTENILPAWLPLPAFSFEVVRRPPVAPAAPPAEAPRAAAAAEEEATALGRHNVDNAVEFRDGNNNETQRGNEVAEEPQPPAPLPPSPEQQSFLRRLLVLAGAIPMSPEEEARAVEQLVDMFPQYDRADLLRELRERGSSEAVVEAVLMGLFSGVPRQGAVAGVMAAPDVAAAEGAMGPNDENTLG